MSKSAREKRPFEKTKAETYLLQNHFAEIGKVKECFDEEVGSSVPGETGDKHILYFEAFLKYPLKLKIGEKLVEITPKEWARAFIQRDISATAAELCNCILTSRNIDEQQISRDDLTKLIQEAALWMISKYEKAVDPWSFPFKYMEASLEIPVVSDQDKQLVYEVVEQWYSARDAEQYYAYQGLAQPERLEQANVEALLAFDDDLFDLDSIIEEPDKYETIFKGFATMIERMGVSMHTAHMVCALTRGTIPTNTDIFVDAVQFSTDRWMLACVPPIVLNIADIASKISKPIVVKHKPVIGNSLNFANDFCPVKRLAIYRGAKFIYEAKLQNIIVKLYDFNSETPEHNVFPTQEECNQIDKALVELFGKILLSQTSKSASNSLGDRSNKSQENILGNGRSYYGSSRNCDSNNGGLSIGGSSIGGSSNGGSGNDGYNTGGSNNIPDGCNYSSDPRSNTTSSVSSLNHEFEASSIGNQADLVDSGEHHAQTSAVNGNYGILPSIEVLLEIHGKRYSYGACEWQAVTAAYEEGYQKNSREPQKHINGLVKAGKKLMLIVFSEEELKNCTPSGKAGSLIKQPEGPLDPQKQNKIMDTLKYLHKNLRPKEPWPSNREPELIRRVIGETSSYIRGKLKKVNCK